MRKATSSPHCFAPTGFQPPCVTSALSSNEEGTRFCLHGLNAVYLPAIGWYRMDPRGNRPDINAQFVPPVEQLAFSLALDGERDLAGIYADPLPIVIDALQRHETADA